MLFVEDNETYRRVAAHSLRAYLSGHEILEAGSIHEAMGILSQRPPDVLVTDIALSDGSGLDLARSVLKLQPEIKCVVVSNYNEGDLGSALHSHAVGHFVPKDRGVKALALAIMDALLPSK